MPTTQRNTLPTRELSIEEENEVVYDSLKLARAHLNSILEAKRKLDAEERAARQTISNLKERERDLDSRMNNPLPRNLCLSS